jgi:hypothetical protein
MSTSQSAGPQPAAERPQVTVKRQPEKRIGPFANGVGVAIWLNTIETQNGQRKVRSVTINPRRYFDRESNQWKDAQSFQATDLPVLQFAIQQALAYCFSEPIAGQEPLAADGVQPGEDIPF